MILLDVLCFTLTLLSVFFTVKKNIYTWPVSIMAAIITIFICYLNGIYGQILVQSIFVIQSIIGWYKWKNDNNLNFTYVNKSIFIFDCNNILIWGIICGFIQSKFTDNPYPYLDSIATMFAIFGTYYLSEKYIESWLYFITFNVLMIFMLIGLGSYILSSMYIIIMLISIVGYVKWRKEI